MASSSSKASKAPITSPVAATSKEAICPECDEKQLSSMAVLKHLRSTCPGVKKTKKKVYKGGSKTKPAATGRDGATLNRSGN